jgi:hypothetical protein
MTSATSTTAKACRRLVDTADRIIENRLIMPSPVEMPASGLRRINCEIAAL